MFPLLNGNGMAEILTRSKTLDLKIDIFFPASRRTTMHSIIGEIARHSSRIRQLSMECIPDSSSYILRALPKYNWKLESLCLSGRPASKDEKLQIPSSMLTRTNELRRLHLSYCTLNWDLLTHCHLTELKLCSIKPGTLSKLMGAMGRMTALESLFLSDAFDVSEGPLFERVHFANLKTLHVRSNFPELKAMFQSIIHPESTRVRIKVNPHLEEHEEIPSFFATIAGSRHGPNASDRPNAQRRRRTTA